ncbi:hypothetical protein [Blastococcus sp. CT_GayMR20]|uniref:hypothetical protein n=1 Tax=Blastococcus sp. CT_GayMR20 TaxID=2559609 RepID=UPI001FD7B307|nr:hypothetical protein [Blastococcus sp. CT_GayMR20]
MINQLMKVHERPRVDSPQAVERQPPKDPVQRLYALRLCRPVAGCPGQECADGLRKGPIERLDHRDSESGVPLRCAEHGGDHALVGSSISQPRFEEPQKVTSQRSGGLGDGKQADMLQGHDDDFVEIRLLQALAGRPGTSLDFFQRQTGMAKLRERTENCAEYESTTR